MIDDEHQDEVPGLNIPDDELAAMAMAANNERAREIADALTAAAESRSIPEVDVILLRRAAGVVRSLAQELDEMIEMQYAQIVCRRRAWKGGDK